MRIITLLAFILLPSLTVANIEINFRPERPVYNESFEMEVIIAYEGSEEPFVSFDPGGLVVEGRRKGGVSFSTQLINGQFTSQKTMSFIYQMRANRAGTFYLRDFKVKVGDKTLSEDNVRVLVLREAEKPRDYFLEATPSKERVYKGEGFFVDYYLYTRVPIYNQELKEYPKLNGFLKRFKNVDETPDRVERGGLIYQRSKKYSARLFAEKTGELTIDALKLQVSVGFGGSGFSGYGLRDMRNVTLASSPVKIEVSEPPTDNVAEGFTGLVGDHSFNLVTRKSKYLVNEPIELKLEVVGPGLLEKMDDPVFYTHPDLESFDTRSEIQEVAADRSRKVIEYTYLPRGQMSIAARTLKLSIFLPDKKSYKTYDIQIPELTVVGGTVTSAAQVNPPNQEASTEAPVVLRQTISTPLTPVSPFGVLSSTTFGLNLMQLALALSGAFLVLAVTTNLSFSRDKERVELWNLYKRHIASGVDYKGLLHFLLAIFPNTKNDLEQEIKESELPHDVKAYFVQLIEELRRSTYAAGGSVRKIKPQTRMFKKLVKSMT